MITDLLRTQINQATRDEMARAKKLHPPYTDCHQAYGKIKEELEESVHEINSLIRYSNTYWHCVKMNRPDLQDHSLCEMLRSAQNCIAELVQTSVTILRAHELARELERSGQNEELK